MTASENENPTYPLPRPVDDPRFNFGLLIDIGLVLEKHGFPLPTHPDDLMRVQAGLFAIIYEKGDRVR